MKYIRTEAGIYDTDNLYICEELNGKPYAVKNSGWVIYKESIIKESDEIKSLCDELVCDNEIVLFCDVKVHRMYREHTVYGAIWTDKGLIYVARMNNKGEFELL